MSLNHDPNSSNNFSSTKSDKIKTLLTLARNNALAYLDHSNRLFSSHVSRQCALALSNMDINDADIETIFFNSFKTIETYVSENGVSKTFFKMIFPSYLSMLNELYTNPSLFNNYLGGLNSKKESQQRSSDTLKCQWQNTLNNLFERINNSGGHLYKSLIPNVYSPQLDYDLSRADNFPVHLIMNSTLPPLLKLLCTYDYLEKNPDTAIQNDKGMNWLQLVIDSIVTNDNAIYYYNGNAEILLAPIDGDERSLIKLPEDTRYALLRATNPKDQTPLKSILDSKIYALAKIDAAFGLIKAGADPSTTDKQGNNWLHLVLNLPNPDDIISYIGGDENERSLTKLPETSVMGF